LEYVQGATNVDSTVTLLTSVAPYRLDAVRNVVIDTLAAERLLLLKNEQFI
jgi:hypothetical protein